MVNYSIKWLYRQENYPHDLEIKEHHTYYILEKRINRVHHHGKPFHLHSKQYSRISGLGP